MKGTLKVEIQDDGTVKIDARGMEGSAEEIQAQLDKLAASIGGDLEIEKHIEGAHHHHHGKGDHHHHN